MNHRERAALAAIDRAATRQDPVLDHTRRAGMATRRARRRAGVLVGVAVVLLLLSIGAGYGAGVMICTVTILTGCGYLRRPARAGIRARRVMARAPVGRRRGQDPGTHHTESF
jgi:hypothetical protein